MPTCSILVFVLLGILELPGSAVWSPALFDGNSQLLLLQVCLCFYFSLSSSSDILIIHVTPFVIVSLILDTLSWFFTSLFPLLFRFRGFY